MTVEEIEIQVTASVEEALKEFKKMLPEIKKQMKQVQNEFNNVDMKSIASKTQNAIQQVKQKIGEIKDTNADKTLQRQFEKASDSVMNYRQQLEQTKEQLRQVYAKMDEKQSNTWKEYTPDGMELGNKGIEPIVNKALGADKEYQNLIAQETKLNQKVQELNQKLQQAKENYKSIGTEVQQTQSKQNVFVSMAGKVNNALQTMKAKIGGIGSLFNKLPSITSKVTGNIKKMSTGVKQGLGHILKYAGALFSLRGVYSILSSSASSWLSSQNAGAQQLSANIEYMKYAMGSVFAPVIQFVTNLVYQLMKAIQSVAYALTGVNIFANASAKSYSSMASSAKKAKNETKQLAGVHDEINNIQNSDSSDSGSGSGSASPSFDLSNVDSQMSTFAQKLYDFFKPLKESWDIYGPTLVAQIQTTAGQIGYLLSSVWGSFENIITNGTVYTTLELILSIIGNIAEAFANAWNYNGNGDIIIQNVANALNNLLTAINNFVTSDMFQEWLKRCSDKLAIISTKLAEIDWQPLIDTIGELGMELGELALDALDLLVDGLKWISEHPEVITNILALVAVLKILSVVIGIIGVAITVVQFLMTPMNLAILAIATLILMIIAIGYLLIAHWDTIKENVVALKDRMVEKFTEIKDKVVEKFTNIKDKAKEIWENIKSTISDKINNLKTNISNVLNNIKSTWTNIWTTLKNTVTNIWNGIWRSN